MRDAFDERFNCVLAESLDRFSRDQEDTAGLFKRLTFKRIRIITLAEGEITHLHVGLKGTMNAPFLQDLAEKTRRGMRGRVEKGRSGGGLSYGYRVNRTPENGEMSTGEREIVPEDAALVDRIFRDYDRGISQKEIAKRLNRKVCPVRITVRGVPARFMATQDAGREFSTMSCTSGDWCGTDSDM